MYQGETFEIIEFLKSVVAKEIIYVMAQFKEQYDQLIVTLVFSTFNRNNRFIVGVKMLL